MMYKIISRTLILITALFLVTSIEVSAQDSLTDSDLGFIADAVEQPENTIENVIIVGDLTFFDNADEALFKNTCPLLAVEDFEDTNVGPNSIANCPNPFNSSTNNACYSPGALIPGFSFSAANPPNPAIALAVVTPNVFGFTNVVVGPTLCADDSVITFTGLINAVGMELSSGFAPTTVDVRVFGAGNVLLGTATVNVTPINSTFLGVIAGGGEQITRIELVETGTPACEVLYELSFGVCGHFAKPIPTLSEWGLIAMAGILGIVGFIVIRRRKVTA